MKFELCNEEREVLFLSGKKADVLSKNNFEPCFESVCSALEA